MKIKSKKGSAMVEATMIFPMVIASAVAVLYIIIGLYLSLSLQASLHLALRKECGEISQTVYRVEQMEEFQYEEEKLGLRPIIKMEEERDYRVSKLFTKDISRTEKGRSYVLDEAESIRILSLAGRSSDLHHKWHSKKGMTSVFLVMILASMLMVAGLFIYASSQVAGRSYADAVLDLAGRSILSEYDIQLQKKYGIFAFRTNESTTEEKLKFYANYSFHNNYIKEILRGRDYLDPLKLELESVNVDLKGYSITDTDNFEQQILAYMKTGIVESILSQKKKYHQDDLGIELKNQPIINSLPSNGYSNSSLDIKQLLKNGIPKLEEIKNSGTDNYKVNEYIMNHFYSHNTLHNSRDTFFINEVEYVLEGNFSDKKNYSGVRLTLVLMRTGLNLTHIYSDSVKRKEVITLASALTPGPEAIATQLVISGVWAGVEAENDMRRLEDGKKVALIKTRSQWAFSLGSAVNNKENQSGYIEPKNKSGNDYEEYLKILLFLENRETKLLRCMDLIQLNLKGTYYQSFDLREYYGGFQFEAVVNERKYTYIQKF